MPRALLVPVDPDAPVCFVPIDSEDSILDKIGATPHRLEVRRGLAVLSDRHGFEYEVERNERASQLIRANVGAMSPDVYGDALVVGTHRSGELIDVPETVHHEVTGQSLEQAHAELQDMFPTAPDELIRQVASVDRMEVEVAELEVRYQLPSEEPAFHQKRDRYETRAREVFDTALDQGHVDVARYLDERHGPLMWTSRQRLDTHDGVEVTVVKYAEPEHAVHPDEIQNAWASAISLASGGVINYDQTRDRATAIDEFKADIAKRLAAGDINRVRADAAFECLNRLGDDDGIELTVGEKTYQLFDEARQERSLDQTQRMKYRP